MAYTVQLINGIYCVTTDNDGVPVTSLGDGDAVGSILASTSAKFANDQVVSKNVAADNPTATDDGFAVGDTWFNSNTGQQWKCLSNLADNAVWREIAVLNEDGELVGPIKPRLLSEIGDEIGESGELSVSSDYSAIQVHDGTTPGGIKVGQSRVEVLGSFYEVIPMSTPNGTDLFVVPPGELNDMDIVYLDGVFSVAGMFYAITPVELTFPETTMIVEKTPMMISANPGAYPMQSRIIGHLAGVTALVGVPLKQDEVYPFEWSSNTTARLSQGFALHFPMTGHGNEGDAAPTLSGTLTVIRST